MIFAREISGPLTSLVKKIDEATAKNSSCRMGSFVVFLGDTEKSKLEDLSKKESLQQTVVTQMDAPSGPPSYKVAKDAEVTVVLYNKRKVAANFTFGKGQLSDKDVDKIVEALPKILPDKK